MNRKPYFYKLGFLSMHCIFFNIKSTLLILQRTPRPPRTPKSPSAHTIHQFLTPNSHLWINTWMVVILDAVNIQQTTSYYFKPSPSFLLSPLNVCDLELKETNVLWGDRSESTLLTESTVLSSHSFITAAPESCLFLPLWHTDCSWLLPLHDHLGFWKGGTGGKDQEDTGPRCVLT